MRELIINKNEAGQRLDKLVMKYLNKAPSSFIYKMLRKKNITLNDKKATGTEKLELSDSVKLYLAEETIENFRKDMIVKTEYNLNILYEDQHILILNKAAGVLSQKARPEDISLIEEITAYLLDTKQITEEELKSFRPGLCNRLDRNTSGIIIAGKSLAGLQEMSNLLKQRQMDKYYQCIVAGVIKEKQQIEGYLYKNKNHNKVSITREITENADFIQTEYEPLKTNGSVTVLKVKLVTGRSHQIRAHLQSIGHSIIGDGKYGDVPMNRYFRKRYQLKHQLLHSYQVSFPVLNGVLEGLSEKTIYAPIPSYFKTIIKGEHLDYAILE